MSVIETTGETVSTGTTAPRFTGTTAPDLLGITLAHRAMLADLIRLTALAEAVRDRDVICTPGHARAISHYIERLCESIHHHHTVEDEVLWPMIADRAGDRVDLTELTADHAALAPRLAQLQARAGAFRLSMGDRKVAGVMALELAELAALLTDHVNDEELELFPLITEHVSAAEWATVEAAAREGGRMSFDGPRVVAAMTDGERAAFVEQTGWAERALLAVLGVLHRRRKRAVFGRGGVSR